jgi:hypothetical protein
MQLLGMNHQILFDNKKLTKSNLKDLRALPLLIGVSPIVLLGYGVSWLKTLAKKPVVIPNIKQIPNGIDPSYGGGFILFDKEFIIKDFLHSGYKDTTLMSSNIPDFNDLQSISNFIGELKEKRANTPFDVNKYVEEIKTKLTLPDT